MNMTESEIVTSYRQARCKSKQIGILSELNACEPGEIVEILIKKGVEPGNLPKKYIPGEPPPEEHRGHTKGWKLERQKRDPETGKIICGQCGAIFDGSKNTVFCPACIEARRKQQILKGKQRYLEKRIAAAAAVGPKKCADCGAELENRLATYCGPCAAARKKESMRRSNERRYFHHNTGKG